MKRVTYRLGMLLMASVLVGVGAVTAPVTVTSGSAPAATTGLASNVTHNTATLNGTVNPNGLATTVYFEWGTDTHYGKSTPPQIRRQGHQQRKRVGRPVAPFARQHLSLPDSGHQ